MKKAIAIASEDSDLGLSLKRFDALLERARERAEFLEKQQENLRKDIKSEMKIIWSEIEKHADDAGLFPSDYSKIKYHLHFEAGALAICTEETCVRLASL